MFGIYKVLFFLFLCPTVWLKPEATWSFCELLYVRSHPAQMQTHLWFVCVYTVCNICLLSVFKRATVNFLSRLFVVMVHRDISLSGS